MGNARIFDGEYLGLKTIEFECEGYTGAFTIDGANLIMFNYLPKNLNLMNTSNDIDALQKSRICGIPILFFPNRVDGGTFTFEGKKYNFPINTDNNLHIHGFLDGCTKWNVVKKDVTGNFINITFEYFIDETNDIYKYFDFKVKITYENIITSNGLFQRITFENLSDKNMPFCFGYHTTFNIPFNDSPREAFVLNANVKNRYEVNEKLLPTGNLLSLEQFEIDIAGGKGAYLYEHSLDNLYLADSDVLNAATITDTKTNTQLVYESDSTFKHWIFYNGDYNSSFLSIEPQTCATNAVNSTMDSANLLYIKPGEEIGLSTKIYVKN